MRKSNRRVKKSNRLRLDAETVRVLGAAELTHAEGGGHLPDDSCDMGGTCRNPTTYGG